MLGLLNATIDLPHFIRLQTEASHFASRVAAIRAQHPSFAWYPYDILGNIPHIKPLLRAEDDTLFAPGSRIADIGAADGDLGYLLREMGCEVEIYDNPPTNMNALRGARLLGESLGQVEIYETDLDAQPVLQGAYDLAIFLGILYHLKNPFAVLEMLARHSRYALVSTRIARHFFSGGPDVSNDSAAYLLGPAEANHDSTNYWIFTQAGLTRLCERSGWRVISWRTVGAEDSTPIDASKDQRCFLLLQSLII